MSMVNIQVKRVYEPAEASDGFRVLVDRLWPQGESKEKAQIDLWDKDIAPTAELRQSFHSGEISWETFEGMYRQELEHNPALNAFIDLIKDKKTVTLVFAAKDTEHTHVKVILAVLAERGYGSGSM
jgi:uncharacterized protein YeaO (DUF488 family)